MSPTKIKSVAFISPFGTICGVAEYARFFAEALDRAKIATTFVANKFSSGYMSCGLYDQSVNIHRVFGTGHAPEGEERKFELDKACKVILDSGAKVVYLNYQDYLYPDKAGLYSCLSRLAARGCALHLIIHDTALPQNFPYQLFRGIIVPSDDLKSNRFPTAGKVFCIPQGIPVFKEQDRNALRKDLNLCSEDRILLATFGLGRTNNKEVLAAANLATKALNLPENDPIEVHMIFAKADDCHAAEGDFGNEYNVSLNGGYMEDVKLAAYLRASSAVVINYPEIGLRATSSAFRFALGAGSTIFARESNWFADVKGKGLYIPFQGVPDLANQLATTFASKNSQIAVENRLSKMATIYKRENNWDAVVEKHKKMWKSTL